MDRKEFLKSACGAGLCGCAFTWLGAPPPAAAEEPSADAQRLAFVRYQLAKMVGFLDAEAPPATCAAVLEKTGRECAKLGPLVATFKGNPEGYFAAASKAWGTEFTWDKERGVVTVAVPPGDCATATRLAASPWNPSPKTSRATASPYSGVPEMGR